MDLSTRTLKVAGLVSSYRYQEDQVLNQNSTTGMVVRSNSGLLIGYGINVAVNEIRRNPIGAPINY